jgi:hypothetical protein
MTCSSQRGSVRGGAADGRGMRAQGPLRSSWPPPPPAPCEHGVSSCGCAHAVRARVRVRARLARALRTQEETRQYPSGLQHVTDRGWIGYPSPPSPPAPRHTPSLSPQRQAVRSRSAAKVTVACGSCEQTCAGNAQQAQMQPCALRVPIWNAAAYLEKTQQLDIRSIRVLLRHVRQQRLFGAGDRDLL